MPDNLCDSVSLSRQLVVLPFYCLSLTTLFPNFSSQLLFGRESFNSSGRSEEENVRYMVEFWQPQTTITHILEIYIVANINKYGLKYECMAFSLTTVVGINPIKAPSRPSLLWMLGRHPVKQSLNSGKIVLKSNQ